jgi:hypothetical protein
VAASHRGEEGQAIRLAPLRRWGPTLAAALLILGGAAGAWFLFGPHRTVPAARRLARPDPRQVYDGPLTNVRPGVAYVGDAACMPCHAPIAESYRRHPMGRSLVPIAEVADRERYDAAHRNPFSFLDSRFEIDRQGAEVRHRRSRLDPAGWPVLQHDSAVHYAIGSGGRGRSYLTDRGGYLFQTPISWFGQKQVWDGSPGFSAALLSGRPVGGECLFCHTNRAHFREGSINRFDPPVFSGHAIGCERCHGPGDLHVRSSKALNIVNPARLSPGLREAVCEQCHLEGAVRILRRDRGLYDFRPGLPLEDFWTIFVCDAGPGGGRAAVTHVEQMHESRCFQESGGKLGCISCHDPHVHAEPPAAVAWYRRRCLECHERQPCSLPPAERLRRQPDDSCIACHMPRYGSADVVHVASTDHRVVRRPSLLPSPLGGEGSGVRGPLAFFHPARAAEDPRERGRDLGLALTQWIERGKEPPERSGLEALRLLSAAVEEDPEDMAAREAQGTTLMLLRRRSEALASFEGVLEREPEREAALAQAGSLAQDLRRWEAARGYWRRAVAVNPSMPAYRRRLVQVLIHLGAWEEARPEIQAWLRLDPCSLDARKTWIAALLHEGKQDEARAEFTRLESLPAPEVAEVRAWFGQQGPR